ncbi:inositol-3-phosphate synthase [Geodermatophilus sp. SYSU D01176]
MRKAAERHGVLDHHQLEQAGAYLSSVTPWPAAGDADFCRNVTGGNVVLARTRRAQVDAVRADLVRFRAEQRLDGLVLVNLASTERWPDPAAPALQTIEAFEAGLDADDRAITPAMVYAYAAIAEGAGYVNFTPPGGLAEVRLPQDLHRRADACACYPTQLGFQFGGVERMRAALAGLPEVLLAGERAREVLASVVA